MKSLFLVALLLSGCGSVEKETTTTPAPAPEVIVVKPEVIIVKEPVIVEKEVVVVVTPIVIIVTPQPNYNRPYECYECENVHQECDSHRRSDYVNKNFKDVAIECIYKILNAMKKGCRNG